MSHLDDQAEWDELLAQIPLDAPTRDAAAQLADLLSDAVQAQRPWAKQRIGEAIHAGLSRTWRSHVQKQRPRAHTKQGDVKTVGGIRRRVNGVTAYVQVPLDEMSQEELVAYRAMHVSNLQTISANAAVVDRLLDVMQRCPQASSPAEACDRLGLDLDAVMAGAA